MTNLEVSCPYCGKMVVLGMEHKDSPVVRLFNEMLGDTKQYSFNGDGTCVCGKSVMATLTVTGGCNGQAL